ncbi:MAG: response regulator [Candidatus Sericytochromatia bacterium]
MSKRVLVIDDDDEVREVAVCTLEVVGGWEVLAASSGPEGLDAARDGAPDAILLDVMMPGMDGPATLRRLRADPALSGIPVIMLTARAQPTDRRALGELGATGVLAKPFDPLTLPDQVSALLGW